MSEIYTDLDTIHKTSSNNRTSLEDSFLSGCFYCGRIFKPKRIKEWIDEDRTALCPHCQIDAVISLDGYPWSILKEMKEKFFDTQEEGKD